MKKLFYFKKKLKKGLTNRKNRYICTQYNKK